MIAAWEAFCATTYRTHSKPVQAPLSSHGYIKKVKNEAHR